MNFRYFLRCLVSAVPLLFFVTPAHADPVSAAIIAIYEAIVAITWVEVIEAIILVAISMGVSYLAKAIAGTPEQKVPGVKLQIQVGGTLPRSFVVGTTLTAGKLAYVNTAGLSGKTPNAFLTFVIAIADIPGHKLTGVWVDDVKATYVSPEDGGPVDATFGTPLPEYNRAGIDHVYVKFYDGTQTVADDYLTSYFGSDPNYPYDSNRIGTGVCYAVVTARFNQDVFSSSYPKFKFELQGIPLYDQRLDSTAGGTGSQLFSDPTTWAYTENPVTITNNVLRGISYNGQWMFGLQGLGAPRLPVASWFSGQNECDLLIDNAAGGQNAQFRCGAEISVDLKPVDVINELLKTCNARLAEIGGIYKVHVGAAGTSVLSFSDSDILTSQDQTYTPFPNRDSIVNGITATYPEPTQGWVSTDAPARYNPDWETRDGGRLTVNVQYPMVPFLEQVQRLMQSAINESRHFRQHNIPLPPECWVLEPNDYITYTSTRNGYSSKLFRVDQVNDSDNCDIVVTISECDPADYDWTPDTDFMPRVDGPLVIFTPPNAQTIQTWSVTAVTIAGADGRAKAGIELTWDVTDIDEVDGVLFRVRLASDHSIVQEGQINNWTIGSAVISENILSATHYEVQGQYRAKSERPMEWTSWLSVTTNDVKIVGVSIAAEAIDWQHLTDTLKDFQTYVADAQRTLRDQVLNLTNGLTQASLGAFNDTTLVRTEYAAGDATVTANYTSAILVATGPSSAIVTDITALTVRMTSAESGITTNSSAITSLSASISTINGTLTSQASSITSLNSGLSTANGNITANASAISSLSTTVTSQGTTISSHSSSITSLNSALNGYTSANAVSTAFSALTSDVSTINGTLTSHSSSITSLNSGLSTANSNISTNASAISALSTTVTSQGSSITSNSSAITSLQSALSGYTSANAVSTAFSSLNSSVSTINGTLTSQASSITSLNSGLSTANGNISANASAISGLSTTVTSQGSNITSISSSLTSTIASVGRINASAYFFVESVATPSGADSRIVLASSATANGARVGAALYIDAMTSGYSRVVVESDTFMYNDPTSGPSPIFQISGSIAYLNVPLYAGAIYASTIIADNIIETNHIQDNAVTQNFPYTAGSTGVVASGSIVILGTDDLSVDYSGYTVFIQYVGSITRQGGHSPVMTAQIFRGDSGGGSRTNVGIGYQSGGSGIPLVLGIGAIAIDTVPGSDAYYGVKITTDDGSTLTSNEAGLIITVYKK